MRIVLAVLLAPALASAQAPGDPVGALPLPPVQPQPAAPPSAWATHAGVTFEANIGFGFAHLTDDGSNSSINTDAAIAGLDIGVGGWINPQLALTGRISGQSIKYGDAQTGTASVMGDQVLAWVGPSLQYWPDPRFWMGGGVGFATYRLVGNSSCGLSSSSEACGINGFGFDFRAGYSFGSSQHAFNASLEVNPTRFSTSGTSPLGGPATGGAWATGIAFLVGYQYL